ncbi:MAG TPA: biopolymer transporter ExbD [Gemmatimonadaceae bacterium]|nr:biopolymer transporter ExbD [Gemmatimonadaceae bacterium]
MPLARSRFQARRSEFARAHGPLNLVPLVDILTAIVFFSLLSAVSLRSALASFDLVPPPGTVRADGGTVVAATSPDVVVRVDRHRFVVRRGDRETLISRPDATNEAAFTRLRQTLTEVTEGLGRRARVTVVPSDDVSYDDVVHVLEQVQHVAPQAVALGSRARESSN